MTNTAIRCTMLAVTSAALSGLAFQGPRSCSRVFAEDFGNKLQQVSNRIRALDVRIERIEQQLLDAMAHGARHRAMAEPFHNLNPAPAYLLYGGPFPQMTLFNGVNPNEVRPVVKLCPASRRYGRIVGGCADAATRVAMLQTKLAALMQERESLYREEKALLTGEREAVAAPRPKKPPKRAWLPAPKNKPQG